MTKVKSYRKKDGTVVRSYSKRNGWAVYPEDRRTPILVSGNLTKKQAVKKALSVKKRGSDTVNLIRRLTDREQIKADKGEWVRGHNIDKDRKNLRGVGPKPLMFIGKVENNLNFSVEHHGETFAGVNKPKRTPNHPTKSHAVLINEGGKKKIVRFGQQGVKGSPKKEGESESYAKRRKAFKSRHSANIKKGKTSAAYWANSVKWNRNLDSTINFAKKEKEVKVSAYRTKKGKIVNPFRRKQEVGTTVKPNNLKTLAIVSAALSVPLIPVGIKAVESKILNTKIKNYQKSVTKALPAPTLGKGMFASVQDISDKEVGKVLDPYGPGFLNSEGKRPIKSLISARDKEFSILNKLKNTGITPKPGKINEFGFTMEKVEGDTLQNFLEQALQDPTDEQLKALGSSVGEAVKKMHSAGVAHRDLHTNNIFVDKKGKIKILDFGKAAIVKELDDPQRTFTSDLDTIIGHVGSYLNKKNIDGPYREVARRKRIFEESVKESYGK